MARRDKLYKKEEQLEQLKKIFSDLSFSNTNMLPLTGEVTVKTEETNQLECDSDSDTEELLYTKSRNYKDRRFTKSPHYAKKNPTNLSYIRGPPNAKNT